MAWKFRELNWERAPQTASESPTIQAETITLDDGSFTEVFSKKTTKRNIVLTWRQASRTLRDLIIRTFKYGELVEIRTHIANSQFDDWLGRINSFEGLEWGITSSTDNYYNIGIGVNLYGEISSRNSQTVSGLSQTNTTYTSAILYSTNNIHSCCIYPTGTGSIEKIKTKASNDGGGTYHQLPSLFRDPYKSYGNCLLFPQKGYGQIRFQFVIPSDAILTGYTFSTHQLEDY